MNAAQTIAANYSSTGQGRGYLDGLKTRSLAAGATEEVKGSITHYIFPDCSVITVCGDTWAASGEPSGDDTGTTEQADIKSISDRTDVPGTLDRVAYETACTAAGVTPLSDGECDSYGVKYGDFRYPEYDPDHIVSMRLAAKRLKHILSTRQQQPMTFVETSLIYRPDASSAGNASCAVCGATSDVAWIAGAGQALCHRHQDDY